MSFSNRERGTSYCLIRYLPVSTIKLLQWRFQTSLDVSLFEKLIWKSYRQRQGATTGLERKWRQLYNEVFWNIINLIPRQCEMKTIIEEMSSTGNLNKVVIHSLFICYFVNTPHVLNGESIPLPFCRKPVFCELITFLYTRHSKCVRQIECFNLPIESIE